MRMTFTYINTALALALASALTACGTAARTAGGPQAVSTGPAATPPDSLRITVGMATTQRGSTIPLSADFFVELRGDSVTAQLPYFGRAYVAPMGTDNVLHFATRITDFSSARGDGGAERMEFKARTVEDLFRFRITVYADGQAEVDVYPQRRERISFDGSAE